ncbi:MAG: MATE family efflux transporter, partial [Candidatus Woesearchaeota archaeon]
MNDKNKKNEKTRQESTKRKEIDEKINGVLNENLTKLLIRLAIPVMLSTLLQTFYNLTDTFWVGRLGSYAIASVTLSFPIIFLTISLASGIGIGGSILMAHSAGKNFNKKNKNWKKDLELILSQTFMLLFIILLVFSIFGFVFAEKLISLFTKEPLVFNNGVLYLRTMFLGFVIMFPYYIFEATLRALGDTKTPLKFVLISVLTNIILDPFLIFGIWPFPKMGVLGAAIATVFSIGFVSFIAVYHLLKGTYGLRIRLSFMKPNFYTIKEILKLGIPLFFDNGSIGLGNFLLLSIVSLFGTASIAAYGIISRLFSLLTLPANGISVSVSTIVAQNFGAKNLKRIFETMSEAFKIGSKLMFFIISIVFLFSKFIVKIFTNDVEVIYNANIFLKLLSPFLMFLLFRNIYLGFFRGIKHANLSMIINFAHNFVF